MWSEGGQEIENRVQRYRYRNRRALIILGLVRGPYASSQSAYYTYRVLGLLPPLRVLTLGIGLALAVQMVWSGQVKSSQPCCSRILPSQSRPIELASVLLDKQFC